MGGQLCFRWAVLLQPAFAGLGVGSSQQGFVKMQSIIMRSSTSSTITHVEGNLLQRGAFFLSERLLQLFVVCTMIVAS